MSARWEGDDNRAWASMGRLGILLVRKVRTNYEVSVMGVLLKERSPDVEHGKARAEAAARAYLDEARVWLR